MWQCLASPLVQFTCATKMKKKRRKAASSRRSHRFNWICLFNGIASLRVESFFFFISIFCYRILIIHWTVMTCHFCVETEKMRQNENRRKKMRRLRQCLRTTTKHKMPINKISIISRTKFSIYFDWWWHFMAVIAKQQMCVFDVTRQWKKASIYFSFFHVEVNIG